MSWTFSIYFVHLHVSRFFLQLISAVYSFTLDDRCNPICYLIKTVVLMLIVICISVKKIYQEIQLNYYIYLQVKKRYIYLHKKMLDILKPLEILDLIKFLLSFASFLFIYH